MVSLGVRRAKPVEALPEYGLGEGFGDGMGEGDAELD